MKNNKKSKNNTHANSKDNGGRKRVMSLIPDSTPLPTIIYIGKVGTLAEITEADIEKEKQLPMYHSYKIDREANKVVIFYKRTHL